MMKTITLTKVNNYMKDVYPKEVKGKLRCECNAEVDKHSKYCWWCGGKYKWEEKNEKG